MKNMYHLSTFLVLVGILSQGRESEAHRNSHHDYNNSALISHYNIFSFGAVGDGISDDSKALKTAWKAACMESGATIEIPSGFNFLMGPLTLQGPCMPNLVLQIDGILLAPPALASNWYKSSLFQWMNFKWVSNFTIQGSGTIDGRGSGWWTLSQTAHTTYKKKSRHRRHTEVKPTVIRFYKGSIVTVRDIHIINSPLCHLKFDSSQGVKVKNITIASPKDSPNTDGIHLQNTRDVEIEHSNIGCGDDCVSLQTGCSNIHIHHIECSPSHGISIGGLGGGSSLACVSNVSIDSLTIKNSLSGVRIKTLQGGVGSVKNVTFSNIRVSDVDVPIVIDQYYCNKNSCGKNRTDAVAISDITYRGIVGSYSYQPMRLACSDSLPCTDVRLDGVQLSPDFKSTDPSREALCWNSYGQAEGTLEPSSVGCLKMQGKVIRALTKSHIYSC